MYNEVGTFARAASPLPHGLEYTQNTRAAALPCRPNIPYSITNITDVNDLKKNYWARLEMNLATINEFAIIVI